MRAVAFVPSAPFLLLDDGPPGLRAAIDEALAVLVGEIVVVGASATPGWVIGNADLSPYGVVTAPVPSPLSLALSVGTSLLAGREHRLWGVPAEGEPRADSLLVVADGTATRSEKAPGYLDPRAAGFDQQVRDALAEGDPAGLLALDEDLAEQLWVAGVPALKAAAAVAPGPWRGEVHYADAPYGVGYLVATWLPA